MPPSASADSRGIARSRAGVSPTTSSTTTGRSHAQLLQAERAEAVAGPAQLARDALDELGVVARPQREGEHGPGVGLHLEVVRQRALTADELLQRRAELLRGRAGRVGVQRHVHVHPPLAASGSPPASASSRSSTRWSTPSCRARAWCRNRGSANAAIRARAPWAAGSGTRRAAESWALTTVTPRATSAGRPRRALELHGQVGGVEARADRVAGAEPVDHVGELLGRLDDAAGLRLERQPHATSGLLLERRPGRRRRPAAEPVAAASCAVGPRCAPGERQRADRSVGDVVGQQCGEQPGEPQGVRRHARPCVQSGA